MAVAATTANTPSNDTTRFAVRIVSSFHSRLSTETDGCRPRPG
jgi:hypothetical protein